MDTSERFCHHFEKGDNFYRKRVASLAFEAWQKFGLPLTHLCLASHKRDICKQWRHRSDAAECSVWSGSTLFSLNTGTSILMIILKQKRHPLIKALTALITKTHLFKYIENFTTKKGNFSDKEFSYFSYFCSIYRLWVLIRSASARRF